MQTVFLDQPAHPDKAIIWQDEALFLLDQRVLPAQEQYIRLDIAAHTATAIREMVVRGAPAIGITAAYGVVLSVKQRGTEWQQYLQQDIDLLAASRPTAVNLFWALKRMRSLADSLSAQDDAVAILLAEAQRIHQEDVAANHKIGDYGAALIKSPTSVITHCNAGALATGGYGTALGVIRSAFKQGNIKHVYADETRPWLQGTRLTAWEMKQDKIPVSVIADVAAAARMSAGGVGWIIVGSDRIAANGDVANKIGTYQLAIAARYHGLKFMVAAPVSTIDFDIQSGQQIPLEQRSEDEVMQCAGHAIGTPGVGAWNPVFDVTPAGLVDVIVTEKGVVMEPDAKKMKKLLK